MKRICAWCKDVMGEKPGAAEETHGVCLPCVVEHFPGMESAVSGLFEQHGEEIPEVHHMREALA